MRRRVPALELVLALIAGAAILSVVLPAQGYGGQVANPSPTSRVVYSAAATERCLIRHRVDVDRAPTNYLDLHVTVRSTLTLIFSHVPGVYPYVVQMDFLPSEPAARAFARRLNALLLSKGDKADPARARRQVAQAQRILGNVVMEWMPGNPRPNARRIVVGCLEAPRR